MPESPSDAGWKEVTAMIKLLLVDDEPSVRRGLRIRLTFEPDVEVVGEAAGGAEALRQVTALAPDVVVMDVAMPDMDGLMATAALRERAPTAAVVILSLYDDAATRRRAHDAGAVAFVGKYEAPDSLVVAIRQAAGGQATTAVPSPDADSPSTGRPV
jgi:DNA-binding NarL/FixJ family response regulator